MTENIIFLILLAAGASFIQRTIGFGFGIFIMTALPFLMPSYGEAVTLSGLLSLTSATIVMVKYLKFVTWKRLLPIVASFIIFSTIAICLLDKIEGQAMRRILGITLILISLYFSFFKARLQKLIRPTKGWQYGTGAASGIMGGLFAMHGPPVVLYLIVSEPDKDHYMGMIQTYAVVTNITMLAVRAFNGYVTPAVGSSYIYSLIGLAIGVIAGNWAFKHIPNRLFTYIVYAYIGVSGLIILLTA
ncbi:MAG: sulfite exporter TauE/SafE family protein [Bacteroidales bacterium]|jgi:uncharacterized membrane protein YfcA|nr:sulfite exporter TauE/SafE family protein [Bacteroidales bacterium]